MRFKRISGFFKRITHKRDIKQKVAEDIFKFQTPIQSILLSKPRHNKNRPNKFARLDKLKEHILDAKERRLLEIKDPDLKRFSEREYDQLIQQIIGIQQRIVSFESKKQKNKSNKSKSKFSQ